MDFDNIVEKTKEGIDIVCKKAEQTARISKLKFEIASLEAKRSKNYEELGRITYAESLNAELSDAVEKENLIKSITEKTVEIKRLRRMINKIKDE